MPAPEYVTYERYLAEEAVSAERHEWFDGRVLAMAGGTEEHAFLIASVIRELGNALRGRPCRVTSGDLRVRSVVTGLATYPDAMVICGKREPHVQDAEACTNPTVIVEVLSRTTEAYDRGEKFEHYRTIPAFREYLLVSTGREHVDHYSRNDDGSWTLRSYGPGGAVALVSIDVRLDVDTLYDGVAEIRQRRHVRAPWEGEPGISSTRQRARWTARTK